jgi:DNA-binding MarR family transcriptional regulator
MNRELTANDQAERLAAELVRFNSVFIRLAGPAEIGFSNLSIVHTLHERGPSRLSDLLDTERIKQPALSAAVNRLVADGLVTRSRDPQDGRASILQLTAAGEQLVRTRQERRVSGLQHLIERLPQSEMGSISSAITLLAALMDAHRMTEGTDSE